MEKMRLLGLGHSHLSCYQQAYRMGARRGIFDELDAKFLRLNMESLQPNFNVVPNASALEASESDVARDPRLGRLARRLSRTADVSRYEPGEKSRVLSVAVERRMKHVIGKNEPNAIVLVAMGNEYNTLALLRHPRPFDFDLPDSDLETDADAKLLSYDIMRAQMRQLAERNVLLFWYAVREFANAPVYVVPPPPPIPSERHILAYPGNFAEKAQKYGISPLPFRRKMWLLYCDVIREAVEAGDGCFVQPPDEIFVDGCLGKQFWKDDPTHANEHYGQIMLKHICSRIFETEFTG